MFVVRETGRPNTTGGSRETLETEQLPNQVQTTCTLREILMSHVKTTSRPETTRTPPTNTSVREQRDTRNKKQNLSQRGCRVSQSTVILANRNFPSRA